MPHTQTDDLSLKYLAKDCEGYSWSTLKSDLYAGCVIAPLTIPQALAYALVAGLPTSAGLYAAVYIAGIVAFFASSKHLITGPSNAIAILIQAALIDIFTIFRQPDITPQHSLGVVMQITLLVGAIQILAAMFKLGKITHFFSHSVIVGYIAGVAVALAINQFFPLLGLSVPLERLSIYDRGFYILTHLKDAHLPTAFIGISCFLVVIWMRRRNRNYPAGAIMLAFISLIFYGGKQLGEILNYWDWEMPTVFLTFSEWMSGVARVGETQGDRFLPVLSWPVFDFSLMNQFLPVAVAIALLSMMEGTSTSKAMASRSGQSLSMNQELFALGIGNFFASFIGAMPVSGSPSRSVFGYENGAQTRFAGIFHSIFVGLLLWLFGFLICCIPISAFAALLIASSMNIVNFKDLFLCLKATRSDCFVLLITFTACIFLSLDLAFYMGVLLSITLYLKKSAVPALLEFVVDEEGGLHSIDPKEVVADRPIRFIKIEGELFFGAAVLFQDALKSVAEDGSKTRVLILQFKNARDMDATACLALLQLYHYLHQTGRFLIGCGIPGSVWDVLSDAGLVEVIGKENLFVFDERNPQKSVQRALLRAKELYSEEEKTLSSSQSSIDFLPAKIVTTDT